MTVAPQISPLYLIVNYLAQSPLLLVWLIAGVAAIAQWQRIPRVAPLVVLGLVIALLDALIGSFLSAWLPLQLAQTSWPFPLALASSLLTVLRSIAQAVAWGLVLWAALRHR